MNHDPIAHNWAPEWITCPTCKGEQTYRSPLFDLDITCPECDGDGGWEP
jgi:DnaJ-class molecular chaperone